MNNVVLDRDIERKKSKKKQSSSDAQFQKFLNFVPVPMCIVDKKGVILDFNDRFVQIFGYTHEEIPTLSELWQSACPDPDYRRWAIDTWDSAMKRSFEKNTQSEPAQYRVICKNGELRMIIVSGTAIAGNFLAAFLDITELRRNEEKISQQQQELKRWYDVTIDRENRVRELKQEVNQLLRRLNEPARYAEKYINTDILPRKKRKIA